MMKHKVSIGELRNIHRDFRWKAERYGFGWRYRGLHIQAKKSPVLVQAFSVLCGPNADDYETQWRVTEDYDGSSIDYVVWAVRQEES